MERHSLVTGLCVAFVGMVILGEGLRLRAVYEGCRTSQWLIFFKVKCVEDPSAFFLIALGGEVSGIGAVLTTFGVAGISLTSIARKLTSD